MHVRSLCRVPGPPVLAELALCHLDVVDADPTVAEVINVLEVKVELCRGPRHEVVHRAQIPVVLAPWQLQSLIIVKELHVEFFCNVAFDPDDEFEAQARRVPRVVFVAKRVPEAQEAQEVDNVGLFDVQKQVLHVLVPLLLVVLAHVEQGLQSGHHKLCHADLARVFVINAFETIRQQEAIVLLESSQLLGLDSSRVLLVLRKHVGEFSDSDFELT